MTKRMHRAHRVCEHGREEGPPNTMISAHGGSAGLQNTDNSTGVEKKDY